MITQRVQFGTSETGWPGGPGKSRVEGPHFLIWAIKKTLVGWFIQGIIPPSYIGIIVNHSRIIRIPLKQPVLPIFFVAHMDKQGRARCFFGGQSDASETTCFFQKNWPCLIGILPTPPTHELALRGFQNQLENKIRGGGFKDLLFSTRLFGEDEPNLTFAYFFRWVGWFNQPPTTSRLGWGFLEGNKH